MKLHSPRWLFAALLIFTLNSCLKDTCRETYRIYLPVLKTLTEARADMKSSTPKAIEHPGKIFTIDKYIFVNEVNRGIHVIDNRDPVHPKNISFINIPGNEDMVIQNNTLYADSYSDLVVFDISSVLNITATHFVSNAFPDKNYYYSATNNPDSIKVVVDYIVKDTIVDCQTYSRWSNCINCAFDAARAMAMSGEKVSGKGGSMARFAIMKNHLYAVTHSQLNAYDLAEPQNPLLVSSQRVGNWNIETIFPFRNKLFIGSTTGMFQFDVTNASNPVKLSEFTHVRSCDPVIADDYYAFVTLRTGNSCNGTINQLDVLDLRTASPVLLKSYPLTNPHGLSKQGNLLFICDGRDGVKVFDAENVERLTMIAHIRHIESYDVIINDQIALVVAKDGLYQYNFSNPANIRLLSRIASRQ